MFPLQAFHLCLLLQSLLRDADPKFLENEMLKNLYIVMVLIRTGTG